MLYSSLQTTAKAKKSIGQVEGRFGKLIFNLFLVSAIKSLYGKERIFNLKRGSKGGKKRKITNPNLMHKKKGE